MRQYEVIGLLDSFDGLIGVDRQRKLTPRDVTGILRLGGIGARVAADLERLTGKEARSVVLGHLQRGGAPTCSDRVLATAFGAKAMELVRKGRFGCMVAWRPPDIVAVPLGEVVGRMRQVPIESDILRTARAVGISLGE